MIAFLGWGSLIWDPQSLPVRGEWSKNGPRLPIEFARESEDHRLTLVITDQADVVPSLWCYADVSTFEEAQAELAKREKVKTYNIQHSIGWWRASDNSSHGRGANIIGDWARHENLDAVLWTNLKYGFVSSRDKMPNYAEVLAHLQSLDGEIRERAEEYIRRAPSQVTTNFRRGFERDFGWTASK